MAIISAERCQKTINEHTIFSDEENELDFDGLFCAGGEKGKDSCGGDSGSAIFMKETNKVVQLGLVSGSAVRDVECGEGLPTFYTRVSYYLKFILDNIKP